MQFLRLPINIIGENLSKPQTKIYIHLLHHHFRFSHGDYSREFFITDRDLASLTGCSTRTIYLTKLALAKKGIVEYRIGPKNKTHYKILT